MLVRLARIRQFLLAPLAALAEIGALPARFFVQRSLALLERRPGALLFVFKRGERLFCCFDRCTSHLRPWRRLRLWRWHQP